MKKYLILEDAKILVKSYNLQSKTEFNILYDKIWKINKPFPKECARYYKESGWISWSDFLNNKTIHHSKKYYLEYEVAKKYILQLNLKSKEEWYLYIKNNVIENIPHRPDVVYKKHGWISWTNFLNDNESHLSRNFFTFEEACIYLKDKNLKDKKEYSDFIKINKIIFLPKRPDYFYKNSGWCGYLTYLSSSKRLSIGEYKIKKWLDDNNIKYNREYSFNELNSGKSKYKFDFYLPELNLCIEFDGEHHFKPNKFFGGVKEHIKVKQRDKIKNEFLNKNNIGLLRVSYLEIQNIESLLVSNLTLFF